MPSPHLEDVVKKLAGFAGTIVGSYLGWYVGEALSGMGLAFVLSMVGTGVGLYYGRKFGARYE